MRQRMTDYQSRVRIREEKVCGVGNWVWPLGDAGAWDGPHKEFEGLRNLFLKHMQGRDKNVIVQAGGCCGMYPRLWAQTFRKVYTFEPDPLNFYCLVQNCQDDKIVKFQAGLGDTHELIWVVGKNDSNVGMTKVSFHPDEGIPNQVQVPQMRIDDLNLSVCDAIQLDVEGWEPHVLMGATETIDRCRPVISVETCNQDIRNFFAMYGYEEGGRNASDTIWVPK